MMWWWTRWRLKSPASRLFTEPFIQAQMKENIKAPRHWPLCGEFTGELPAQRASNAENVSIWWRHHGSRIYRATPKNVSSDSRAAIAKICQYDDHPGDDNDTNGNDQG